MPLHIPATFRDVPSKIEEVIPEHRIVRYVYYNKIIIIFMNLSPRGERAAQKAKPVGVFP